MTRKTQIAFGARSQSVAGLEPNPGPDAWPPKGALPDAPIPRFYAAHA